MKTIAKASDHHRPGAWVWLLLGWVIWLVACSAPKPADYANEEPRLDLREYFDGRIMAYGIFTDRAGRVARRFEVDILAYWEGENGTLEEDFVYSDGTTERRVWRLQHQGGGRYIGRADDVVGEAQGQVQGNAFQWRYTLRLPVNDRTYDVQFNDWMFLMDDTVMLNRAVMSKWGIRLGEVTLTFIKQPAVNAAEQGGATVTRSGSVDWPGGAIESVADEARPTPGAS